MSIPDLSLLFEGVVAALLAVTIFYAVKLNRHIAGLRRRESELQGLIANFNRAAERAETSAAALKSVGSEAERSLRAAVEKARALRDDLVFMTERGDAIADNVERSLNAARKAVQGLEKGTTRPADPAPAGPANDEPDPAEARSDAERELLRALRAKKRTRP